MLNEGMSNEQVKRAYFKSLVSDILVTSMALLFSILLSFYRCTKTNQISNQQWIRCVVTFICIHEIVTNVRPIRLSNLKYDAVLNVGRGTCIVYSVYNIGVAGVCNAYFEFRIQWQYRFCIDAIKLANKPSQFGQ